MSKPVRFFPIYQTNGDEFFAEPKDCKIGEWTSPSTCSNPTILENGSTCAQVAKIRVQVLQFFGGPLNTRHIYNQHIVVQDLCVSCAQTCFPRVFTDKYKEMLKMKEAKATFCNNCKWDAESESPICPKHNFYYEDAIKWAFE